jgi:hypothetical protein
MAGGRPTEYRPEFAVMAHGLCQAGATDFELAEEFDVDVRTIYRWKAKYPEFCQALKMGKENPDDRMEASLYHRGIGYSHHSVKIMSIDGVIHVEPFVEHYPPDTAAAFIWLKNRRPEAWRERREERTPEADAAVKTIAQKLRQALHDIESMTDAGSDNPGKE